MATLHHLVSEYQLLELLLGHLYLSLASCILSPADLSPSLEAFPLTLSYQALKMRETLMLVSYLFHPLKFQIGNANIFELKQFSVQKHWRKCDIGQ